MASIRASIAAFLTAGAIALAVPCAQADTAAQKLSVELNAAETVDKGCRVSFLVNNAMGSEIAAAVFEIAVIGADDRVSALIRLDFGRLPAGKSKVRQFDIAGKDCDGLTRVLLNDVAECSGKNLTPAACLDALAVSTRSDIGFDL